MIEQLTPNEQRLLMWALLVCMSVIAWIGKLMVDKLGNIAVSVSKIEKEISVLTNDHTNLKDSHNELKGRVQNIETALIKKSK